MKLKEWTKALIRAQKIIGKGEKSNRNTGRRPQVLRQWDDVAKKYTDTVTGYKYTFTFDGAEDVPSS